MKTLIIALGLIALMPIGLMADSQFLFGIGLVGSLSILIDGDYALELIQRPFGR